MMKTLMGPPKLARTDLTALARIAEIRTEVGMYVRDAHDWTGPLARLLRAKASQGSNSIEGHHLSLDDTLTVLDGHAVEGDVQVELDQAAVQGHRDAMSYLLVLARDSFFAYDVGSLRALHRLLMQPYREKLVELKLLNTPGHQDPRPGSWRRGHIAVGDYTAPDIDVVVDLLAELVETLNRPRHFSAIVCAAMAHLNYVSIHPHSDGNGRMSRALQTLVLARETDDLAPEFIGVEEWLGAHRKAYYDALTEARRKGSLHWVRFCLDAHLAQSESVLADAQGARRRGRILAELCEAARINDRAVLALWDAAEGRRVTNTSYRQQAELDRQAATYDLRLLDAAGLLRLVGKGAGAHYVAGDKLTTVLKAD
ncbi:MAG: Fic family protein [Sporichthyaceae bacterium]